MLDLNQFYQHVIVPAAERFGSMGYSDGPNVRALMLGTALAESSLVFIRQIRGPARGVFQIEPPTYIDTINRWPKRNRYDEDGELIPQWDLVNELCGTAIVPEEEIRTGRHFPAVTSHMLLGSTLCRMKYLLDPRSIPAIEDSLSDEENARNLYDYYKRVWNSHLGAATWEGKKRFFIDTVRFVRRTERGNWP